MLCIEYIKSSYIWINILRIIVYIIDVCFFIYSCGWTLKLPKWIKLQSKIAKKKKYSSKKNIYKKQILIWKKKKEKKYCKWPAIKSMKLSVMVCVQHIPIRIYASQMKNSTLFRHPEAVIFRVVFLHQKKKEKKKQLFTSCKKYRLRVCECDLWIIVHVNFGFRW